ncbi:hypothetical protein KEM55_008095 [Ascosphaera atra]|nr:hypothetical protein KEM55_008095 [Ascosphaera atra]
MRCAAGYSSEDADIALGDEEELPTSGGDEPLPGDEMDLDEDDQEIAHRMYPCIYGYPLEPMHGKLTLLDASR